MPPLKVVVGCEGVILVHIPLLQGMFPTNHVSSKYWMNSRSCGVAVLIACQARRTKRTGTNASAAVL